MDILHRIGIHAPAARVHQALTTTEGLAGWWTRDTSGDAAPDGHLSFRFRDAAGQDVGGFTMQVLAQRPVRSPGEAEGQPQQAAVAAAEIATASPQVHWRVQNGPAEWIGTEVSFTLGREDGQTIVLFAHRGWREAGAFMAHCSTKWASFLLSLRAFAETGRGQPAPDDLKISNWH